MGYIETYCTKYSNWVFEIDNTFLRLLASIPIVFGVFYISLVMIACFFVQMIPSIFSSKSGFELYSEIVDALDKAFSL